MRRRYTQMQPIHVKNETASVTTRSDVTMIKLLQSPDVTRYIAEIEFHRRQAMHFYWIKCIVFLEPLSSLVKTRFNFNNYRITWRYQWRLIFVIERVDVHLKRLGYADSSIIRYQCFLFILWASKFVVVLPSWNPYFAMEKPVWRAQKNFSCAEPKLAFM